MRKIKKVVLAYSGGLDTSVMVHWLKEKYNCEVICFAANLGQEQELKGLKQKAIKTGAKKIYIEDLRDEFVKEYVFPMLKANAIYEDKYLLGTAIARPLIAKKQVEIAKKEKADAVAHGATGKGNDQVRFEVTYKALAPELRIVAPWREWALKGRTDEIKYAKRFKIPITSSKEKPYSTDRNLWHISYEGGILEDPWQEPDESMFTLTSPVSKTPNKPEYVEVYFEKGIPKKVNGKDLSPVKLIESLNKIAGKHGVGRVDIVENRLVGIKSRGVYETPAGTVLYLAHQALETIALDRDTQHFKQLVAQKFAEIIYYGKWFSNLRRSLEAFIDSTQLSVTGWTRLKLFKGGCQVVGRKAKRSLYVQKLATFEEEELYNQKDAEGFINLFGLQEKVNAIVKK
jgi:argininosuccinate synthase